MVKEKNEVYKCSVCGNMVEVTRVGGGELVCCDQPMELLEEKTEDKGQEKHVPITEDTDHGILVKVGEIPHPMEKEHYIEWIEVITAEKTYRTYLIPGNQPEATFCVEEPILEIREFCNVHGLWKS